MGPLDRNPGRAGRLDSASGFSGCSLLGTLARSAISATPAPASGPLVITGLRTQGNNARPRRYRQNSSRALQRPGGPASEFRLPSRSTVREAGNFSGVVGAKPARIGGALSSLSRRAWLTRSKDRSCLGWLAPLSQALRERLEPLSLDGFPKASFFSSTETRDALTS